MKKPSKEYNLKVKYPELVKEWFYSKNNKRPEDYLPYSNKKVFWKCDIHDYYLKSIDSRTFSGQGCPYCAGRIPHPKDNLKTNHPELIEEWHPTLNKKNMEEFVSGTRNKAFWLCSSKKWGVRHTYKTYISFRTIKGQGCPYCAGKKPSEEYNLEKLYPELMDEWDYSKNKRLPNDYTPHSGQYVWWNCPKSDLHTYKTIIDNRTGKKTGCPYCDGKKVCEDNNLLFVNPELAKELHPTKNGNLNPSKIHYGSSRWVWWKCSRNHSFKSQIHSRVKGKWGCPKCSGTTSKMELRLASELEKIIGKVEHRKKIEGIEIDVYLPHYKLGIEYDGWYWHQHSIEKDKQKNINLKKMGILLVRIREEGYGGQLPKISRKDVLHKKTDKEIDVIKKLLITLTKTIEFSDYRKKIINRYLKKDEFWNDKKYFEYLDQMKKIPIEKSIQNTNKELLKYWHQSKNGNLNPKDVTINSEIKVWWLCERGEEHEHLSKPRDKKRNGCSICKIKPIPNEKSLEYNEPELSKLFDIEKNGITPRDVPKSTARKFWWKCPNGKDHKWEFPVNGIKRKKTYCPFCSGHKVSITNCLNTLYPEYSKEWHPTKNGKTTPKDVYIGSSKKMWFLCSKGHEWKTMIWTRTRTGSNCPRCMAKLNADKRFKK